MKHALKITVVVEQEDDGFVSLWDGTDIASQGATVEEAVANLKEAVELFLETASPTEIEKLKKKTNFRRFDP